jgi:hypothetical protein
MLLRSYMDDLAAVGRHLRWPESKVQAAVAYAEAFPEEIDEALKENEETSFESLRRMLPQTQRIDLSAA